MSDRLGSMARETGTRIILTYRDYEALPADGRRYELHEGNLAVTPAPGTLHQRAVGMLYRLLSQYAEAHRLGDVFVSPVDCILSNATVVQPDIVYVESSRSSLVSPRGIEGPPTLVIEVLSPSSALIDQGIKRQLYARYGIPYYWIVASKATLSPKAPSGWRRVWPGKRAAASHPSRTSPSFRPRSCPDRRLDCHVAWSATWPRGVARAAERVVPSARHGR